MPTLRSPEHQLLDFLEKTKEALKHRAPVMPSLMEYNKTLLDNVSALFSARDDASAKNAKEGLGVFKTALQLTFNLCESLINRDMRASTAAPRVRDLDFETSSADSNFPMNEDALDALIKSLCQDYPNKDEMEHIVSCIFVGITKNYKEKIEATCRHYKLNLPVDSTPVVLNIDMSAISETCSIKLTAAHVQEIKYMLEILLNSNLEQLESLHPILNAPFMRRVQIPEAVVSEILKSLQDLSEKIGSRIKETQEELLQLITKNKYPQEMQETQSIYFALERQCLDMAARNLEDIRNIRSQLTTASGAALSESLSRMQEIARQFSSNIQKKIETQQLRDKVNYEFLGARDDIFALVRSTGQSPEALGMKTNRESRFGVMEEIIDRLIKDIEILQVSAMKDKCDFELRKHLSTLKEQIRNIEIDTQSLIQLCEMTTLTTTFKTEIDACMLAARQIMNRRTSFFSQPPGKTNGGDETNKPSL